MNNKNLQADIVIIGGGGAGLAAAVAAAEAGVKNIILLESRHAPGGNSLFPGGLMAAETPLQKRLGIDASRDTVYLKTMEYAHWKLNGRLVRTLVNRSTDTIAWLEKKGLVFEQLTPHYYNPLPNTFHSLGGKGRVKTGAAVVKTLVGNCQDLGVNILLSTSGEKILTANGGKISGVLAKSPDGEIRIDTGCVITATGGFSGNFEMLKKFDPSYNDAEVNHTGMMHHGDGMRMAVEIGAAIDQQVTFEMFGPNFKESLRLDILAKRPSILRVNKSGERFHNENTASDMEAANTIYRQPRKLCYSLFDDEILQCELKEALAPIEQMMIDEKSFKEGIEADLADQSQKGNIKIAGSWAEIAAWIKCDPEVLEKEVELYNSCCDRGYDEIFLKNRRYLRPLRHPPLYAVPGKVAIVDTHGGIITNHRLQALNEDGQPVPGLYAAGIEIAGTEANTYNMFISGHSFGFSLISGRIAGEEAARFVTRS